MKENREAWQSQLPAHHRHPAFSGCRCKLAKGASLSTRHHSVSRVSECVDRTLVGSHNARGSAGGAGSGSGREM